MEATRITQDNKVGILYYDEVCDNPRKDFPEGEFLFLGFPHRRYNIGDETLDPSTVCVECPECGGSGENENIGDTLCLRCDGQGDVYPKNLSELAEMVGQIHNARLVVLIGMIDHSGVSYYVGGGAHWSDSAGWDSGTCGLMVVTDEVLEVRGGKEWAASRTEADLMEAVTLDIETYSSWASGDVYGNRVFTVDEDGEEDEELDACWGFIGYDYAMEELKSAMA